MRNTILTLFTLLQFSIIHAQFSSGNLNSTNNMLRVTAYDAQPSDGEGVEMGYEQGISRGFLQAYNRTTGQFKKLTLFGSDITLHPVAGTISMNGPTFYLGQNTGAHREALRLCNTTPNYGSKMSFYQDLPHEIGHLAISRNGYDGRFWLNLADLDGVSKTRMFVNGETGNVGIGHTSPVTRLQVHKEEAANSASESTLAFAVSQYGSYTGIGGNSQYSILQSYANKPLYINKEGNHTILNLDASNVGIGTANPQSKLSVKGTVQATKVKVTQNAQDWPDFVFDTSFQLTPLPQLEYFVRMHKHLPGIPTAKEVGEQGIDVGENQAKLLQKIEELTLYLIEQNKLIAEQAVRIRKLEEITMK